MHEPHTIDFAQFPKKSFCLFPTAECECFDGYAGRTYVAILGSKEGKGAAVSMRRRHTTVFKIVTR